MNQLRKVGIYYDKVGWDSNNNCEVISKRQEVQLSDIEMLHPFHWDTEFNLVVEQGGFDIIVTNPPWEILKRNEKEFFTFKSVSFQQKMPRADFELERIRHLEDPQIRDEWLTYINSISIQSSFFSTISQYRNQEIGINSTVGIPVHLLFIEQCYNLLSLDGMCGLVLPSGIYSDSNSKQLRKMLFNKTEITGLLGFENSHHALENIDHRFKFALLTFKKGGHTQLFPATFKLHDINKLEHFTEHDTLTLSVDLIRRCSPELLAIMEFKDNIDVEITDKRLLQHPPLGEKPKLEWDFELRSEFHMLNHNHLFSTEPGTNLLPLYEGKMIDQFSHRLKEPRFWVDAVQGRNVFVKQELQRVETALDAIAVLDGKIRRISTPSKRVSTLLKKLGYPDLSNNDAYIDADAPRLTFRNIAGNTNRRTLIATILPQGVFVGNTLTYIKPWRFNAKKILDTPSRVSDCYEPTFSLTSLAYLCGVFNSFVLDYQLRSQSLIYIHSFVLYRLSVPRLAPDDPRYTAISNLATRLICIDPDFDTMQQELLGNANTSTVFRSEERSYIQSEIDGIVAHLYNLNENEFAHILDTFPLVEYSVRDRAKKSYIACSVSQVERRLTKLIDGGEVHKVEFKVASYWNEKTQKKEESMKDNIIEEVAAFLNSREGGTILVGVNDKGKVIGLEDDYKAVNPQKQDRDRYELFLLDLLRDHLNGNYSLFYHISFSIYEGKEICIIDVDPSPKPVFLKRLGDFYIRDGARKTNLSAQKAVEYIKERWS